MVYIIWKYIYWKEVRVCVCGRSSFRVLFKHQNVDEGTWRPETIASTATYCTVVCSLMVWPVSFWDNAAYFHLDGGFFFFFDPFTMHHHIPTRERCLGLNPKNSSAMDKSALLFGPFIYQRVTLVVCNLKCSKDSASDLPHLFYHHCTFSWSPHWKITELTK